jgi:two-component system sensor histidine kinase KdpD
MITDVEQQPKINSSPDSLIYKEKTKEYGKLKIFFGMCDGIGKTHYMLQTAIQDKEHGTDVVLGFIEPERHFGIDQLVHGFELIPAKKFIQKGLLIQEVDVEAIIARNPQLVIIDDLSHTNTPGSRHLKRFQDVQEILDNGITVYSTVNVYNLESQSDEVSKITGVRVRETLPDVIFESADDIELVDLSPDELIKRFCEGRIYTPVESLESVETFFQRTTLGALRQMALHIVGDQVDKQLQKHKHKSFKGSMKSGIHLLVAIDYQEKSIPLIRWAKNLSNSMGADIQALYVENSHQLTNLEKEQLDKNINLIKQLGINFRITTNYDKVKGIIGFAKKENITHILIGKPRVRNILTMFKMRNIVNGLIRYSGNIDVYILSSDTQSEDHFINRVTIPAFSANLPQYLMVTIFISITSIICYYSNNYIGYQAVAFMLLFLISIMALFYGTGPILFGATISALVWDYFFTYPKFSILIANPIDVFLLVMFFIIALLNGVLTSRVRMQEKKIRTREERTQALYQLTKELSQTSGIEEVSKNAEWYIRKYFHLDCAIILKNEDNQLENQVRNGTSINLSKFEFSVADWVFRYSGKAGKYTNTFPSTEFTFYPLAGIYGNMGVIAVKHHNVFTHGEEQFWEAFLSQISGKYERDYLRSLARQSELLNESEKLYNTIFNSISHELRIPVATIMGSSEALLTQGHDENNKIILYSEINTASVRLHQLIENLLNMSRLESGHITPHPDWCDVLDIANKTVDNLSMQLKPFNFYMQIQKDMPLVFIDSGLIEQVLYNLVLNATQYAPEGTSIRVTFNIDNGYLTVQVMDRGKGFPEDDLSSVFNKFYRGKDAKAGGTGLGLSIVKGYVEALQGMVSVENRKNGGAKFTLVIPVKISDIEQYNKQDDQ